MPFNNSTYVALKWKYVILNQFLLSIFLLSFIFLKTVIFRCPLIFDFSNSKTFQFLLQFEQSGLKSYKSQYTGIKNTEVTDKNLMNRSISMTIRNPLVRAALQRFEEDEKEKNSDHLEWYELDEDGIPNELLIKYHKFHQDAETTEFLDNCYEKADWIFTQIYHTVARVILGWFISQTSANGFLGRGSMFVYSSSQFKFLLGDEITKSKLNNLLDLGAGDGKVTEKMAGLFNKVYTTETSGPMISHLKQKGYSILGIDEWTDERYTFDVISCLNLLDRCYKPIDMLKSIKSRLTPVTGKVVIAIVLPFTPYVEFGSVNNKPIEYLNISGSTVEEQIVSIIENVFTPLGFEVEKFSKLPYLCEGDLRRSFYYLYDIVFVLRVSNTN